MERDDWGDTDEDFEDWAEASSDQDEDEPTVPCPYCRREIHEDTPRCPYCEQYISKEDSPSSPKPWWLAAGVVLCLAIVGWWILGI